MEVFEIKIYGEIVSTYAKQNGAKGFCLSDLQAQLEKAEGKPVKVRINSPGGDAAEGFEIYNELRRYALNNSVPIHTFGEGMVASIATVIFLAGERREITKTLDPFAHNAQWDIQGDSRDMSEAVKVLERWNDRIAKHYAEHTDLSYIEAKELMNKEAYITPEEAKRMKFATVVESVARPTVLARFSNTNKSKMSTKKKGLQALFDKWLGGISNKIVLTADQKEVDFYELGDDDPIEVGAKATIDGADAEGEVVMADGNTYVFAGGELTEIREPEDDGASDQNADEIAALQAKIEELTAANASLTEKNESISAKLKTANGAIAKFRSEIESDGVDDEPEQQVRRATVAKSKPGSRALAAIELSKKNVFKKK